MGSAIRVAARGRLITQRGSFLLLLLPIPTSTAISRFWDAPESIIDLGLGRHRI